MNRSTSKALDILEAFKSDKQRKAVLAKLRGSKFSAGGNLSTSSKLSSIHSLDSKYRSREVSKKEDRDLRTPGSALRKKIADLLRSARKDPNVKKGFGSTKDSGSLRVSLKRKRNDLQKTLKEPMYDIILKKKK